MGSLAGIIFWGFQRGRWTSDFPSNIEGGATKRERERQREREEHAYDLQPILVCGFMDVSNYRYIHCNLKKLDDGWPESAAEHVTLVLLERECKEYIKDVL